MPTKKVFLKCNRPFVHQSINSPEAMEYMEMAKKSVGSYFYSVDTQRKGTGLSDEEVKVLLPQLINVRPEDPSFRKEVDRFYTDIHTVVPYAKGLELEIGLEIDNDAPLFSDEQSPDGSIKRVYNMPMDLGAYIRYRHAVGDPKQKIKGHPDVARSPEEAKGNQLVDFYIEDPEKVLANATNMADIADRAINAYQLISKEEVKLRAVLTMLSHLIKKAPGEVFVIDRYSPDQVRIQVRNLATGKPNEFLKAAEDTDLINKFRLRELIRFNLLKRSGTTILVSESNDPLGLNEDEAVIALFHNPANSQLLQLLKAQYEVKKEEYKKQIAR